MASDEIGRQLSAIKEIKGIASTDWEISAISTAFVNDILHKAYTQGRADAWRWIPVSERLPPNRPEDLKLVLAYVKEGSSGHSFGHCETLFYYPDGTWSHIKSEEYVTHWMPLPKLPGGEND